MIEFADVKKVYPDGTKALEDFSLKINEGEFVTLIGPSGCGKTTTMKMVNRLIEPTSGTIYINDTDINTYNIHELRWNIGYVLQQIALFPHMTIEENIAVVPEMKKWKRKQIQDRSKELLEMVGLDPSVYMHRRPDELSGGEQQRVGVIRALAANPNIILMDEPFSALDPISREQLQHDIRELQQKIRKTIVFVTHDIDEALALGDKVCLMREGRIIQVDTPQQLVLNPKTQFVKDFIGERKSPWQTAVDVIAEETESSIITKSAYEERNYPDNGMFIIKDEANKVVGALTDGHYTKDVTVLENDLPLYKAADLLQTKSQLVYPIIKDEELLATLTYKDIITYLRRETAAKDGVIQ
ncbi:ABC transporter ATP-binding protein [Lentibacillus amyloliquefaciens]|uniref:Carnitine transport ATP-binding protein OpuCA n=1 Tax=Lentibacillus amyloliquefaciens TaxID=1472767 RepID=A0A0U4EWZ1_9BACI|nr:ABC transporter ATP-binding protein [Lentibacillus amyloliquefaciens]ALX47879.1 choline ABC transporter ATP-binding protein [Lentibacillus amyloliquefaciens]